MKIMITVLGILIILAGILPFLSNFGILPAIVLAISPWHLQFSRAAFETNLSVTVTTAAVLCFLIGIRKRNFLFPASAAL